MAFVAHLSPSFEQRDSVAQLSGPKVHVAVRNGHALVSGQILDRLRHGPPHRQMRTERVTKNVPAGDPDAGPLLLSL